MKTKDVIKELWEQMDQLKNNERLSPPRSGGGCVRRYGRRARFGIRDDPGSFCQHELLDTGKPTDDGTDSHAVRPGRQACRVQPVPRHAIYRVKAEPIALQGQLLRRQIHSQRGMQQAGATGAADDAATVYFNQIRREART
jgi:hypothetical protein